MEKRYILQLLAACFAVIMFCLLLCIGGEFDFTEQVILSMTQEEYDSVKAHLTRLNGSAPSEREIAHWWSDHHPDN